MGAAGLIAGLIAIAPGLTAPAQAASPQPLEWRSPGAYTWTVPAGVTEVRVDIAGGSGGNRPINDGPFQGGHWGGVGDRIQGTLAVTPGETLSLYVAARGSDGTEGGGSDSGGDGGSGWRSGGDGGSGSRSVINPTPTYGQGGGGGGGSSYIGGPDYRSDVHVGGGGGAGGFAACGGNPGGDAGQDAWKVPNNCASDGGDPGRAGAVGGHGEAGEDAGTASNQGGGGGGGAGVRSGSGGDASTDGGGGGGGGTSSFAESRLTLASHSAAPRGHGFIVLSPVYGTQTTFDYDAYDLLAGRSTTFSGTVGYPADADIGVPPEGTVRLETGAGNTWSTFATVPLDPEARFSYECGMQCSLDAAADQVRAVYLPADENAWERSTGTASLSVTLGATRTQLNVDPLPAVTGQERELTASVDVQDPAAGTADGTVEFWVQTAAGDETELIGEATLAANGQAVLEAVTPFMGDHRVRAVYTGADWYNGSTSAWQTITTERAETETSAEAVPSPSVYGQDYSIEIGVTPLAPGGGVPEGEVEIVAGDQAVVAVLAGGEASVAIPGGQEAGDNEFAVRYLGTDRYNASATALEHTIEKADVDLTLTQSAAESSYGQPVSFEIEAGHVAPGAGAVEGLVELVVDGEPTGTSAPLEEGRAALELATMDAGTHVIEAHYHGSGNSNPATSNELDHEVVAAEAMVTWALERETITTGTDAIGNVAVGVASSDVTVTGEVEIRGVDETGAIGADVLAHGKLDGGAAQFVLEGYEPGEYQLVAVYTGSGNVTGGTSESAGLTVLAAESDTALDAPESVVDGERVELTARVDTRENTQSRPVEVAAGLLLQASTAQAGQWQPFAAPGQVQFLVDGEPTGQPVPLSAIGADQPGAAEASLIVELPVGEHRVEARYLGSDLVLASAGDGQSVVVEEQPVADDPQEEQDKVSDEGSGDGSHGLADTGAADPGLLTLGALLLVLAGAVLVRRHRAPSGHIAGS